MLHHRQWETWQKTGAGVRGLGLAGILQDRGQLRASEVELSLQAWVQGCSRCLGLFRAGKCWLGVWR
jgi:hypothetical protein